jgi:uncharacterized protein
VQHAVEAATGSLGGVLGWLTYAVQAALVGVILGAVVAYAVHLVQKTTALGKGAN